MRQDTWYQDILERGGDSVDVIVEEWRRERPDLDPSAKAVTGRVVRLASLFQQAYAEAFEPLGLNEGDYGILTPLRRAGAPFEMTPTELARHRMMTSGGMTAALDRLEGKGFIERVPNPADRRGSLVRLTKAGHDVIDAAMARHVDVEGQLISGLSDDEQAQLTDLLRKLLKSVDPAG